MKRTAFALLVAAASLVFSSVAVLASSTPVVAPEVSVAPQTADPDPVDISIHGLNDEFSPQVLTIDSGVVYRLTLFNDDTDEHDWEVDNVGLTKSCVGPCQQSVTFTAPAPGTYKFYCIVHSDMGGTLFVR